MKNAPDPALGKKFPRRPERRFHFFRMMAIIVNENRAVALADIFKSPRSPFEIRQSLPDFFQFRIELVRSSRPPRPRSKHYARREFPARNLPAFFSADHSSKNCFPSFRFMIFYLHVVILPETICYHFAFRRFGNFKRFAPVSANDQKTMARNFFRRISRNVFLYSSKF